MPINLYKYVWESAKVCMYACMYMYVYMCMLTNFFLKASATIFFLQLVEIIYGAYLQDGSPEFVGYSSVILRPKYSWLFPVIFLFLFLQSLSSIINGNKCSQYLSSHIYLPEFISIPKTLLNSLSATTFNTIKYNECLLKLQKLGTQGLQHNDLSSLKPFIIYYKLRLHW